MAQIPTWADLGTITDTTRLTWENETGLRNKYRRYFDGSIFSEKVPIENSTLEEAPLMYPVAINLVKLLCEAQADSLFGEWEDQVVKLEPVDGAVLDSGTKAAIDAINAVMMGSNINTLLWEMDIDRQVYGGSAIKITPSNNSRGHVRWQRIHLDCFYPVFDPDDPDNLLEVYTAVQMTAEQARMKYGLETTSAGIITRIEHWTATMYESWIDGRRIDAYCGVNPWGVVPYVFFPRIRTQSWFGDALTSDIIPVQDELNMRIADLGESISYSAHPTRWGRNLPHNFNTKNFPLGANILWDLGRALGANPPPEVGMLEAKNPIPTGVFDYIKFIYDWSRTSTFAPPIVFGEDNGGGQRSGATLEIRMWPLIKAVRRSRSYLTAGLQKAMYITGLMYRQRQYSDIPVRAIDTICNYGIVPVMASIMPKDHVAIVDEVVKLASCNPPEIDPETAQKVLGRSTAVVQKIKDMVADDSFYRPEPTPVTGTGTQPKNAAFGKTQPQDGGGD